jgi:hypothetical protein
MTTELGIASNTVSIWRREKHLPRDREMVAKLAQVFVNGWKADQRWVSRFLDQGEYEA